jgi:DNA-binding LytR/AlgR family response regulator
MKLTCMIIDDEPIARAVLREFIDEIDYLELVHEAGTAVTAMELLKKQTVDLLFLDINMPKMTGYEFLKTGIDAPLVVITTAYTEFAVEGFSLNVTDYLVKPFSFERFEQACARVKKAHQSLLSQVSAMTTKANHFFVKNNGSLDKIYYNELYYVEGLLNYVMLHTQAKKIMVYLTIKSMMEQLPPQFIKVHKSFIVNTEKIKSIEGNIIDIGNARIAISQNLKEEVIRKVVNDNLLKR